jgi:hypothetical protein
MDKKRNLSKYKTDLLFSKKKDCKSNKNKEIKKPNFWTEEEDKILKEKAKEFNYKNWKSIANFIPGKNSIQCSARFRRIRPGLIKGAWGKEEDSKLISLYEKYGRNWAAISKEMNQRTGKQIRDRFLNSLDTRYKRGKFSEEEDKMILKYHKIYGNQWAKIAKKIKTRTGDMIKNRFYSSLQKDIKSNKNFLKKKRKKSTKKYKTKNSNRNNSKIIIEKKSFENDIGNDKENGTTDAKDEKKDILRNSIEKAFKIINLKNEGNYIKRKNTIQYNSSKLKIIIDNYQKK